MRKSRFSKEQIIGVLKESEKLPIGPGLEKVGISPENITRFYCERSATLYLKQKRPSSLAWPVLPSKGKVLRIEFFQKNIFFTSWGGDLPLDPKQSNDTVVGTKRSGLFPNLGIFKQVSAFDPFVSGNRFAVRPSRLKVGQGLRMLHFALRRRTGTLILCWTRLAVAPRTMSAIKR